MEDNDDVTGGGTNVGVTSNDVDIEQNTPSNLVDVVTNIKVEAKNLITALSNPDELYLTDDEKEYIYLLLHRSVEMYGVGANSIYVWIAPRLVPIATWIDPEVLSKVPMNERTLVQKPNDAYANVDLVGALWVTKSSASSDAQKMDPKRRRGRDNNRLQRSRGGLHWRELSSVINDPDQSSGLRTEAMYNAGLEKATGIKFNVYELKGMVVYYSNAGADEKILMDPATETYMCQVVNMKASLLAAVETRRNAMAIVPDASEPKQSDTDATSLPSPTAIAEELHSNFHGDKIGKHLRTWLEKTAGAGAQIPPCFSWTESCWTAVGTFIGCILIALLNKVRGMYNLYMGLSPL